MISMSNAKGVSLTPRSWRLSLLVLPLLIVGFEHALSATTGVGPTEDVLSVSLPSFTIGQQETIVGVEYDLRAGVIVGIGQIRSCWDIHIYNGDELKSKLQAQPLFLSAGIRNSNLSYLNNFILIRHDEPGPDAHLFNITVKLTVTDARWDKIRYVTFYKDQLILTTRN